MIVFHQLIVQLKFKYNSQFDKSAKTNAAIQECTGPYYFYNYFQTNLTNWMELRTFLGVPEHPIFVIQGRTFESFLVLRGRG